MLHVYEFELFIGQDGWIIARPFDFDGATQGADLAEVSAMAADWLKLEIEFRLMDGRDIPEATFGHEPTHEDGRILLVAVEASLDTVPAVTASVAAELLGVSRARVSQMLKAGLLMGFRKGRDSFITRYSVDARLREKPKAGRPKKAASKPKPKAAAKPAEAR